MMDERKLNDAIREKTNPIYAATYNQVRDYYQEHYKAREWIGAMAQAVSGSDNRSSKEYKAARRSIERHETGQYKGSSKVYVDKFVAAGMKLDPIGRRAPGDTITLTVSGTQAEGKGTRERTPFTVTFTGPDSYQFVNNPSYRAFFKQLGYPDHVIDMFENGEYELTVTSVA